METTQTPSSSASLNLCHQATVHWFKIKRKEKKSQKGQQKWCISAVTPQRCNSLRYCSAPCSAATRLWQHSTRGGVHASMQMKHLASSLPSLLQVWWQNCNISEGTRHRRFRWMRVVNIPSRLVTVEILTRSDEGLWRLICKALSPMRSRWLWVFSLGNCCFAATTDNFT